MSKSAGNAIPLSASPDDIRAAVRAMYTDPGHLRVEDPGRVEGNVVFAYLDAFDPDAAAVADLKARYRKGGLGDTIVKRRLEEVLEAFLRPIRERRREFARDPGYVLDVMRKGTKEARAVTEGTISDLRDGLGMFRL